MDVDSFISLFKVFVRSHLEWWISMESTLHKYFDGLEKVQKRASKILSQCRQLDIWITGIVWIFESTNTGI